MAGAAGSSLLPVPYSSHENDSGGTTTKDGYDGADWMIKYYGVLPEYYISKRELRALGWRKGMAPSDFAPGKMVTGGIYQNWNGHLPTEKDRIWYEADLNYREGPRNGDRIVWSNDGLIFVTYDHYETFHEIV